ncbi:MAG: guanylate kinase [Crocinitomicaceae bacterium]|nr:guanylate kinase [Crocinitomicaceae bacterium]
MNFLNKKGKSIIVSAPSGAGKTTIVHALIKEINELSFSISACSREPRPNEIKGKDYCFLSVDDFLLKIKKEEFLEWQEVYKDHYYGTLKSEVNRLWSENKAVIFDVDVKGAINLKNQLKEEALSIFIKPLNINVLENRLRNRKTETEEKIQQRLKKAKTELHSMNEFDLIILNDNLQKAIDHAVFEVRKHLNK